MRRRFVHRFSNGTEPETFTRDFRTVREDHTEIGEELETLKI
jgi:hypothetical protein